MAATRKCGDDDDWVMAAGGVAGNYESRVGRRLGKEARGRED